LNADNIEGGMSGRVADHLPMSVHVHNAKRARRSANFYFDDEPQLTLRKTVMPIEP